MKIARIFAQRVELPLIEGSYEWSGGKSVSVFDSAVVGVETACGLVGYGEVCLLGPFYLPAYGEGVRAGLRELAPHLLGFDPRELSAEDRRQGDTRFQLKVGGDPDQDIERSRAARGILQASDRLVADANTGWTQHEAMRVVRAVREMDAFVEQPCLTYEECLAVRRHTDHPFVLDENIDSLDMRFRGRADLAMDVVNLKISKLGGLTESKSKQARDLCVAMRIAMTLEDPGGGDLTTAATKHLAHSTPEEFRFTSTDFNSYVAVSTATGAPRREHGLMRASRDPGLGIAPRSDVLGPRIVEVH